MIILSGIPIPPSLNQSYPANRLTGRRFKSRELVLWEKEFQGWALSQHLSIVQARDVISKEKLPFTLSIRAVFYFEWSRIIGKQNQIKKLDIDNRIKHLLDALCQRLWIDDKLIFRIMAEKVPMKNSNDFVNVAIEKLPFLLE